MSKTSCFICGMQADIEFGAIVGGRKQLGYLVKCQRCSKYQIDHNDTQYLESQTKSDKNVAILSYSIRQLQGNIDAPLLSQNNITRFLQHSLPGPIEQKNNFVLWLGLKMQIFGRTITESISVIQAEIGSLNIEAANMIIMDLKREDIVKSTRIAGALGSGSKAKITLTSRGWEAYETLKQATEQDNMGKLLKLLLESPSSPYGTPELIKDELLWNEREFDIACQALKRKGYINIQYADDKPFQIWITEQGIDASNSQIKSVPVVSPPMNTSKIDTIFISYAKEDIAIVLELYKSLEAQGLPLWIDFKDLLPGQEWKLEIEKAIRKSKVFITCLSKNSVTKRGFVQVELKKALEVAETIPEGEIYIIPVRLDNCEVPRSLEKWQWINYFEEKEKLLRAIQLKFDFTPIKNGPRVDVVRSNQNMTVTFQEPTQMPTYERTIVWMFPFTVVETSLVGQPEEMGRTGLYSITVTATIELVSAWNLFHPITTASSKIEVQKVESAQALVKKILFWYGRRNIETKLRQGILAKKEVLFLDQASNEAKDRLDPLRIPEPNGFKFEV